MYLLACHHPIVSVCLLTRHLYLAELVQLSSRIERAIQDGTLGEPGAGVEDIIVGGMHSLMIDETGRVSITSPIL